MTIALINIISKNMTRKKGSYLKNSNLVSSIKCKERKEEKKRDRSYQPVNLWTFLGPGLKINKIKIKSVKNQ